MIVAGSIASSTALDATMAPPRRARYVPDLRADADVSPRKKLYHSARAKPTAAVALPAKGMASPSEGLSSSGMGLRSLRKVSKIMWPHPLGLLALSHAVLKTTLTSFTNPVRSAFEGSEFGDRQSQLAKPASVPVPVQTVPSGQLSGVKP